MKGRREWRLALLSPFYSYLTSLVPLSLSLSLSLSLYCTSLSPVVPMVRLYSPASTSSLFYPSTFPSSSRSDFGCFSMHSSPSHSVSAILRLSPHLQFWPLLFFYPLLILTLSFCYSSTLHLPLIFSL